MKVTMYYSWKYDEMLAQMTRKKLKSNDINDIIEFTKRFEKRWKTREVKILNSIEKNSKLKFKEKAIRCYFVNHMIWKGNSQPLTVKMGGTLEDMEIVIIHELIHNIMVDNKDKLLNLVEEHYPEEGDYFRVHIPLLLIEKGVIEDIYGKKFFNKFLERDKRNFKIEWSEVLRLYPRYKKDIIKFLKNEDLE